MGKIGIHVVGIWNSENGIRNPEGRTLESKGLESRIQRVGIQNPESRGSESGIQNPEGRNPESGIQNPKGWNAESNTSVDAVTWG